MEQDEGVVEDAAFTGPAFSGGGVTATWTASADALQALLGSTVTTYDLAATLSGALS